jgi:hypothetical protein
MKFHTKLPTDLKADRQRKTRRTPAPEDGPPPERDRFHRKTGLYNRCLFGYINRIKDRFFTADGSGPSRRQSNRSV